MASMASRSGSSARDVADAGPLGGDGAEEPSGSRRLGPRWWARTPSRCDVVDGAQAEVSGLGDVEGVVGVIPCAVNVAVGPGQEGAQVVEVGGRQRCVADPGEVGGEVSMRSLELVTLAGGEEARGEGDEEVAAKGR